MQLESPRATLQHRGCDGSYGQQPRSKAPEQQICSKGSPPLGKRWWFQVAPRLRAEEARTQMCPGHVYTCKALTLSEVLKWLGCEGTTGSFRSQEYLRKLGWSICAAAFRRPPFAREKKERTLFSCF
ncbi:Hypothetical predicted protein [Podarcis lilfordi]|uniref:Uncharacterized protein n=1 Tax=Podarcis lilfordi TaxID=74358 RepID=A0AA35KX93_9SAUR|nr:Hypothetical predicted protein [Podarcis lilfordi]